MNAVTHSPALRSTSFADAGPDALLEALRSAGVIAPNSLPRVREALVHGGTPVLRTLGTLSGDQPGLVANILAQHFSLARLDEAAVQVFDLESRRLSLKFLKSSQSLPVTEADDHTVVAALDPTDPYVADAWRMALGRPVQLVVATPIEIERVLERLYENGDDEALDELVEAIDDDGSEESVQRLLNLASETPVVRMVNALISRAIDSRASDIHIEPFDGRLVVRYRIDGVLKNVDAPPARSTAAVTSRIKIMAKLDIAERRLPQDGRMQVRVQGKTIELRVSTIPTMHGESVVLRILDKENLPLDFEALGFEGDAAAQFHEALAQPHGILLVTGPTGSGKTTTLYAALHRLNHPERKIVTVEDPVEYQLAGINQIQVKPQIDLNFASALRSIVRQDPDIIMIGEMRDRETASIAVQSALTGHLVLSTLHTNDAGSSITRLLDMGVADYLLTSTVRGVIAQRLVRTLCMHCRVPSAPARGAVDALDLPRLREEAADAALHDARGCERCAQTGFSGRTVIFEFLPMTDTLKRLILDRKDGRALQEAACQAGMRSMFEDGISKALRGITTLDEVLRVTEES